MQESERERLRRETINAINQVKSYEYMTLEEIALAEDFFSRSQDLNEYLEKINNQRKIKIQTQEDEQANMRQHDLLKDRADYYNQQSKRKWIQANELPRTGKLSTQQKKLLKQRMSLYLSENHISLEKFIYDFDRRSVQNPKKTKMWAQICSVLPDRSVRSSYRYLIRQLSMDNQLIKWEQKEIQKLISLQALHGNNWKLIGKLLQRQAENVRNKFRSLRQAKKGDKSDFWSLSETIIFLRGIEKSTGIEFIKGEIEELLQFEDKINEQERQSRQKRLYNSKKYTHPINEAILQYLSKTQFFKVVKAEHKWKQIAQKLQHKCELSCKNKFKQLVCLIDRNCEAESEIYILQFLKKLKIKNEDQIDWSQWPSDYGITEEEASVKWKNMQRLIRGRKQLSFKQILGLCEAHYQKYIDRLFNNKIKQVSRKNKQQTKETKNTHKIEKKQIPEKGERRSILKKNIILKGNLNE